MIIQVTVSPLFNNEFYSFYDYYLRLTEGNDNRVLEFN